MAQNYTQFYETIFDTTVQHFYQSGKISALRGTFQMKDGKKAQIVRFNRMGQLQAQLRTQAQRFQQITNQHPTTDVVESSMQDYTIYTPTDIFDAAKARVNELKELAYTVAYGMTRRVDQMHIDALENAAGTTDVSVDEGGADSNLNIAKMTAAKAILDKQNVPHFDRYLLIHSNQIKALLGTTEATSTDYSEVKALMRGEINQFLGFKIIAIGDMVEGGVPLAGDVRTCFAWQRSSAGYAESMEITSRVDWRADITANQISAFFSATATAIDPAGIVKVACSEA